jgi:hypothetical protein
MAEEEVEAAALRGLLERLAAAAARMRLNLLAAPALRGRDTRGERVSADQASGRAEEEEAQRLLGQTERLAR